MAGGVPTIALAVAAAVMTVVRRRRLGGQSLHDRVERIEEWLVGKPSEHGWSKTEGFIDEWPRFRKETRDGITELKTGVQKLLNGEGK